LVARGDSASDGVIPVAGSDLGLLILRIAVGLIFAAHGAQKAFGWWSGPGFAGWRGAMERMQIRPAGFWAFASMTVELAGGGLLVVGLLSPLVSALLVAQSIVIIVQVHLAKGFWNRNGGIEFPLSLLGGVAALAGTGPGSASLDAALGLAYATELRAVLVVVALGGAGVALAIPRLWGRQGTTATPPR
jgi:putative oxidoreductase